MPTASPRLAAESVSAPILDGLGRWLTHAARRHPDVADLFPAFCAELLRRGLPVWRASLALEILHPETSGSLLVWADESLEVRETARAELADISVYVGSPVHIVDETGAAFRRRLDGDAPGIPLLEELRALGASDYFITPLPFLDDSRTAAMSFATRRAGGFGAAEIDALAAAADLFGPYAERQVLRRIAVDLLDTYVGPGAGRRIIEGQVERGQVERIEAAIWFADLRGFTQFSEEVPTEEVMALLNAWFEIMVGAVEAQGGEVLKFIGDAVLAIFAVRPERSRDEACRRALAAAELACEGADELAAAWRAEGRRTLDFALALHVGEIAYGNVGAPRRLDFTVLGPAVNRASRLQALAKRLGRRVLVSKALAACVEGDLVDLGKHRLKGVARPQRVFGLADGGDGERREGGA